MTIYSYYTRLYTTIILMLISGISIFQWYLTTIYTTSQPIYPTLSSWIHIITYTDTCYSASSSQVCSIIPHQQTIWFITWIETILSIGTNMNQQYNSWLYNSFKLLTTLSPYRATPYTYSQIFVPISTQADIKQSTKQQSWEQAVLLWSQWVRRLCDSQKIKKIWHISDSVFAQMVSSGVLHEDSSITRPCPNYLLPSAVGFTYFFYIKDRQKAIFYYKLASFDPDIPERIPFFTTTLLWSWRLSIITQ